MRVPDQGDIANVRAFISLHRKTPLDMKVAAGRPTPRCQRRFSPAARGTPCSMPGDAVEAQSHPSRCKTGIVWGPDKGGGTMLPGPPASAVFALAGVVVGLRMVKLEQTSNPSTWAFAGSTRRGTSGGSHPAKERRTRLLPVHSITIWKYPAPVSTSGVKENRDES